MSMPEGEDFLWRPVLERLCTLRELQDGTYDLADVAAFNEVLDVRDENTRRINSASRTER